MSKAGCFGCFFRGGSKEQKRNAAEEVRKMEAQLPAFVQKEAAGAHPGEPQVKLDNTGEDVQWDGKVSAGVTAPATPSAAAAQAVASPVLSNGAPNGQAHANNVSGNMAMSPASFGDLPNNRTPSPDGNFPLMDLRSLANSIRSRKEGAGGDRGGEVAGLISADLTMSSTDVVGAPRPLGTNGSMDAGASTRKAPPPSIFSPDGGGFFQKSPRAGEGIYGLETPLGMGPTAPPSGGSQLGQFSPGSNVDVYSYNVGSNGGGPHLGYSISPKNGANSAAFSPPSIASPQGGGPGGHSPPGQRNATGYDTPSASENERPYGTPQAHPQPPWLAAAQEEAGMNWFSATSREGRDMLRSNSRQKGRERSGSRSRGEGGRRDGSIRSSKSGRSSSRNREREGSIRTDKQGDKHGEWEREDSGKSPRGSRRSSRANSRSNSRPPSRPASRSGSVRTSKTGRSGRDSQSRRSEAGRGDAPRGDKRGPLQEAYLAKWNYDSRHPDELSFQAKDVIWAVQHADDEGWIVGIKGDRNWGMRGLVPITHLVNGDLINQARKQGAPPPVIEDDARSARSGRRKEKHNEDGHGRSNSMLGMA
mmetsp:Transcript_40673/g.99936  ORF Transcript_40673/g.99936 Transcript_40673/m.99936 type:complete len:589 (+) Transcript_40673:310-2076(+)